ncbi:MAG: Peptidoglycan glycosyltransferase, partial [Patescibacteria group bacterium]|nr:Peptidoglycan glycosyltransferase [Patescibacteria group bacterium]
MVFLLYMSHTKRRKAFVKKAFKEFIFLLFSLGIIAFAVVVGWLASMELPDFNNFENRAIANSTKIYDRTGKIVLYNIHDNIKRTEIPLSEMSPYIKQATIAIEDAHFYEHYGFRPVSFVRAVLANFRSGSFSQGGSTLNQQIVKNALLTREKTVSRKLKEIVLAIKLDRELPKDIILQIYLNESPYGGTLYGIEEASLAYFGKHAKDLSLTESAYLASLPQSPTRLSPYGKNRELLEARKNLVLERMFELGYITEQEKITSQGEKLS